MFSNFLTIIRNSFSVILVTLILTLFVAIFPERNDPLTLFVGNNQATHINWHRTTTLPYHRLTPGTLCHTFQQASPQVISAFQAQDSPLVYQRRDRPTWIDAYTLFFGWSNTYQYIAESNFESVRVWDVETQTVIHQIEREVRDVWWSADDRYLAVLAMDVQPAVYLLELNTGLARRIPINTTLLPYDLHGEWTANGEYFVLVYRNQDDSSRLVRYSVVTETSTLMTRKLYRQDYSGSQHGIWDETGQQLRYWEHNNATYTLIDYNIATNNKREITTVLRPPRQYSTLSAVYDMHSDGTYSIRLIDLTTLTEHTLWAHSDDLGDPTLRDDHAWIAAVYDADPTEKRDVRLGWSHIDGNSYREYRNPDYEDIRHVEWSQHSDKIVFVGIRLNGTYDLHITNLRTGATVQLIDQAPDLIPMTTRYENQRWAYTHSDAGGNWYWLGLNTHLQLTYRVQTGVYIHRVDEYPSPDGTEIALKLHGEYPKRYIAIGKTGYVHLKTLRDDLAQRGGILWSPNQEMLQFGREVTRYSTESLVYNTDGEYIATFSNTYGAWMTCN